MCVTGCPDLNIRILDIGDILDIVEYHQIYHQKRSSIFKHLQDVWGSSMKPDQVASVVTAMQMLRGLFYLWPSLDRSCGGVIETMVLSCLPAHPLGPATIWGWTLKKFWAELYNNFGLISATILAGSLQQLWAELCNSFGANLQHSSLNFYTFFGLSIPTLLMDSNESLFDQLQFIWGPF